jgi:glycosyltransferase involved in cell wall biosynthesis
MSKSPHIRIIAGMPAYNEGEHIGSLILSVHQYTEKVIVIDNGSTDNTAEISELEEPRRGTV